MIKGIVFDMDGVLVDSIGLHYKVWQEVGRRFGFPMTRDFFDYENGMDTVKIVAFLIEKFDLKYDPEVMVAEKRRLSGELLQKGVALFPDVEKTLITLKRLGYRIGLATMSTREHVEYCLAGKFTQFEFDELITVDEVQHSKPHPEIFLKCAQALEVPPQNCIVVEDSLNGIEAAKTGGMIAVAITNTTPAAKFTDADRIITKISELDSELILSFSKGE